MHYAVAGFSVGADRAGAKRVAKSIFDGMSLAKIQRIIRELTGSSNAADDAYHQ
jgi:hypothetical protein